MKKNRKIRLCDQLELVPLKQNIKVFNHVDGTELYQGEHVDIRFCEAMAINRHAQVVDLAVDTVMLESGKTILLQLIGIIVVDG